MTKEIGIGKAHSKIILMGEHSVVYGYPAIAIPLNSIEVECSIYPANKALEFDFEDTLSTAIYAALDYLNKTDVAITYHIKSEVPQKRGMGSSAAVSIAAIRAVFDYFEQEIDDNTLEILVNQAEIIAHTNPSGLDAKTCLSDQAIKFIRNVGFETIELNLNAYLIIADTGIHGHTKEAVEKVAENEIKHLPLLSKLGELTEDVEKQISAKNIEQIGKDMSAAHAYLDQLGVSIPFANDLVKLAEAEGSLGAKMSGGGLGGCIIALADNLDSANYIEEKLREKGAIHTWIQKL